MNYSCSVYELSNRRVRNIDVNGVRSLLNRERDVKTVYTAAVACLPWLGLE